MSYRKRSNEVKERLPPFTPLLESTMDAPAWRAMSHGAKWLYTSLKRRYIQKYHNNGKLWLSQEQAETEVRSDKKQIQKWFRELQYYGFIRQTTAGSLGLEGEGKSPHWRLTELGYMRDHPTRDFLEWNGIKFKDDFSEASDGTPIATRRRRFSADRYSKAVRTVMEMPTELPSDIKIKCTGLVS